MASGPFDIVDFSTFEARALALFRQQARKLSVYATYLQQLGIQPPSVRSLADIPFMPIAFFKSHTIYTAAHPPEKVFLSSGTTGQQRSRHPIARLEFYHRTTGAAFRYHLGDPASFTWLALLPNYLEQGNSSLVAMIDYFMGRSNRPLNGFFLRDRAKLLRQLKQARSSGEPTILFGVTYALLDFAEYADFQWPELIVMETGGMKGRKEEIVREEVHRTLRKAWGVGSIHSEYGMTELMSQAYAKSHGRFYPPPWMQVQVRDVNDPFSFLPPGKTGALNIIDLANEHTCAFIETEDLGRVFDDGSFEVVGRLDNTDVRGCSLLAV